MVGGFATVDIRSCNRPNNPIEAISGMRISSADSLPLESKVLKKCKSRPEAHDENAVINVSRRQAGQVARSSPPPSPRSNWPKLLLRKTSSSGRSTSSLYAGPQPTHNGCPLKSCLKSHSLTCSSSSHSESEPLPLVRLHCRGHRVTFSDVTLREYCRQVGDNPSVSSGCPLGIGWKFNKRGKMDIDSFEADRDRNPTPCQRLSPQEREDILSNIGGISHTQIMQGQINAYFDRQLRAETLDQIGGLKNYKTVGPRERLYIMKESAARKLNRAKTGISPSQQQQELWNIAEETARRRSAERFELSNAIGRTEFSRATTL